VLEKKIIQVSQPINRRRLLQNALVSTAAWPILANSFAFGKSQSRLSAGTYIAAGAQNARSVDANSHKNFVALLNLQSMQKRLIEVPYGAHSIQQHPFRTHLLVAIPKEESSANIISNFNAASEVDLMPAADGNIFSGHGVFSPDGTLFFTSETDKATESGDIVVRDGATFKIKDRFKSGGSYPHEMHFVSKGNVLAVANGGFKFKHSNLSFLDPTSGNVLGVKKASIDGPGIRHFTHDDSGHYVLGTWSRYDTDESKIAPIAEMLLGKPDSDDLSLITPSKEQQQLYKTNASQFLSVFFHKPSRQVVITATSAAVVAVVDIFTGKVNAVLKKSNPTGICQGLTGNAVLVGDSKGFIQTLDMTTLEWSKTESYEDTQLKGSHFTEVRVS
jgi:hypothetical protein